MLSEYWPHLTVAAVTQILIWGIFLPWVLLSRKEPVSAVAWSLVVIFLPFFGAILFWAFGYNYLLRKVQHRRRQAPASSDTAGGAHGGGLLDNLSDLATRVNAFPLRQRNAVTFYHETTEAFAALLAAIEAARDHVHLEFFIFRSDATGMRLIELLGRKAADGVEIRLLYDAMGCMHLKRNCFEPLVRAGGQVVAFLPLNLWRSRIQVHLRNHRKIVIVDGKVGFTGGMNIGDEYLHQSERFGYWRDFFMRLEGPAVADLRQIFNEDWEFAGQHAPKGDRYFPEVREAGNSAVQVARSGPDQPINTIREILFMAMLGARERLWLASPYFIPDSGLLDALRVARYRGVDVRLLTLRKPDHFLSYHASRFYYTELLEMGVAIYLYAKGMMHSKLMLVDDKVALVGSANLDYRSLRLNFEAGVLLPDRELIKQLEVAYQRDLETSELLDAEQFAQRSLVSQIVDNACRLFAPNL